MIQQVLQGFGTVYIEGHRRVLEITADILNNVSNNCKYGRYCLVVVFALTAARILKDTDKEMALNDKSVCAACFDLQKVLITPQSEVSTFYYKSKLAMYNFTVYDMGCHEGYGYVWNEEIAKRGSNEIGSCILHFLKTQKEKGIQKVFVYSDNCGGQNRNRFIFSMFSHVSMLLNGRIIHQFMEISTYFVLDYLDFFFLRTVIFLFDIKFETR
jgi:hypothetical protein